MEDHIMGINEPAGIRTFGTAHLLAGCTRMRYGVHPAIAGISNHSIGWPSMLDVLSVLPQSYNMLHT